MGEQCQCELGWLYSQISWSCLIQLLIIGVFSQSHMTKHKTVSSNNAVPCSMYYCHFQQRASNLVPFFSVIKWWYPFKLLGKRKLFKQECEKDTLILMNVVHNSKVCINGITSSLLYSIKLFLIQSCWWNKN